MAVRGGSCSRKVDVSKVLPAPESGSRKPPWWRRVLGGLVYAIIGALLTATVTAPRALDLLSRRHLEVDAGAISAISPIKGYVRSGGDLAVLHLGGVGLTLTNDAASEIRITDIRVVPQRVTSPLEGQAEFEFSMGGGEEATNTVWFDLDQPDAQARLVKGATLTDQRAFTRETLVVDPGGTLAVSVFFRVKQQAMTPALDITYFLHGAKRHAHAQPQGVMTGPQCDAHRDLRYSTITKTGTSTKSDPGDPESLTPRGLTKALRRAGSTTADFGC